MHSRQVRVSSRLTARVGLAHDTMAWDADSAVAPPPQPGINGIRYSAKTGYVYYTSTAQKVFMRVPVDKASLDPAGDPEFVAGIDNCDDFCIDDDAGFAYVSRHRANTLDRVPLEDASTNIEAWMLSKVQRAFAITIGNAILVGSGQGMPMGILNPAAGIPICETAPSTPVGQISWQDLIMLKFEVPLQYHGAEAHLSHEPDW
jgi:hypothetical protein